MFKLNIKSAAAIKEPSLVKAGSLRVRVKVFSSITRASVIKGAVISFKLTVEVTWLDTIGFPAESNIEFELIFIFRVSSVVAAPIILRDNLNSLRFKD